MKNVSIGDIFDEIMADPSSMRGLDVEETCRMLASKIKALVEPADYLSTIKAAEEIYLERFIQTCTQSPTFATRVRRSMAQFI